MNLAEKDDHLHFLTSEEVVKSRISLIVSMVLSIIIFFIELYGAILSNSLALLSDAFHIVMDISAHLISLFALNFSLKKRTLKFTFGFVRFEILAAFINCLLLVLLCGYLVHESIKRILDPKIIEVNKMLAFSLIGLFMNSLSAYLLFRVSKTSINLKSAYLHALGDLLGTISVIVGAIIIRLTDIIWIDSILSFVIVMIIIRVTYYILMETTASLLEASPDSKKTYNLIEGIKKVMDHDGILLDCKHWNLTAGVECFHCRILLKNKINWESSITRIHRLLKEEFGITHASVEPVTKESNAVLETIKPIRYRNPANHCHINSSHHHHHGH